jgi:MFS family permease
MSKIFDMTSVDESACKHFDKPNQGVHMSHEEKGTWIYAIATIGAFGYYLVWLILKAQTTPPTEIAYVPTMLWIIGIAIIANIVGQIFVGIVSGKGTTKKDQRDLEIYKYGEYIGQSFVILGAVIALGLAMLKLDHFWIANVICGAFVLSALTSSLARLIAYRTGF